MVFRIFMFIMDLLIPAAMILFGILFKNNPPDDINYAFGYRTKRSMQNKDTWQFAQREMGRVWYKWGIILFLTAIPVLFFTGTDENTVSVISGIIVILQTVAMIMTVIPVEKALKSNFDENGKRK